MCLIVVQAAVNEETCSSNSPNDDATCMLQTSARVKDHKGSERSVPEEEEDATIEEESRALDITKTSSLMNIGTQTNATERSSLSRCGEPNNLGVTVWVTLGHRTGYDEFTQKWACSSCWYEVKATQWWDSSAFQTTSISNGNLVISPQPDCVYYWDSGHYTLYGKFKILYEKQAPTFTMETKTGDASYIDYIRIYQGTKASNYKEIGRPGIKGWCFSADAGDSGVWSPTYCAAECWRKFKIISGGTTERMTGWRAR
jgi:hypothetical protein